MGLLLQVSVIIVMNIVGLNDAQFSPRVFSPFSLFPGPFGMPAMDMGLDATDIYGIMAANALARRNQHHHTAATSQPQHNQVTEQTASTNTLPVAHSQPMIPTPPIPNGPAPFPGMFGFLPPMSLENYAERLLWSQLMDPSTQPGQPSGQVNQPYGQLSSPGNGQVQSQSPSQPDNEPVGQADGQPNSPSPQGSNTPPNTKPQSRLHGFSPAQLAKLIRTAAALRLI